MPKAATVGQETTGLFALGRPVSVEDGSQKVSPYRLHILSGLSDGAMFDLADERINIGREDHNQIVLEDRTVSHFHAVLIRDGATFKLRDLISTNGTFVNGQRIMNQTLRAGDAIRLGTVEARFECDIAQPPNQPSPERAGAPAEPVSVPLISAEPKAITRQSRHTWLAWVVALAGALSLSLIVTHYFKLWPFTPPAGAIEQDVHYQAAAAAEAKRDYRTVLYNSQILARRYPRASLPEFMLGVAYGQLGAFDESAAAFRRAVELKPDDVDAWFNLGVISYRRGYPSDAVAAFQKAVKLRPTHTDAWTGLVNAYVALKELDKAGDAARELRRLDPAKAERLASQLRPPAS